MFSCSAVDFFSRAGGTIGWGESHQYCALKSFLIFGSVGGVCASVSYYVWPFAEVRSQLQKIFSTPEEVTEMNDRCT